MEYNFFTPLSSYKRKWYKRDYIRQIAEHSPNCMPRKTAQYRSELQLRFTPRGTINAYYIRAETNVITNTRIR